MALRRVILVAATFLSIVAAQAPQPVGNFSVTPSDMSALVSFTSFDSNAVSFEVTTIPTRFFPAPVARVFYGDVTGSDAICVSGGSDSVLDTSRWDKYQPPGGSTAAQNCPLPYTTTSLCVNAGYNAAVQVSSRVATLLAYHGAIINTQAFWRYSTGIGAGTPSSMGGAVMLAPNVPFRSDAVSRAEAKITGFPVTYDWNRYSYSGAMIYDLDSLGRVRPLFKTGLYEWLGYLTSWYPTCSGTPSTTATCSWTANSASWSIGGSVTTAPTASTPWTYGITRDPFAGTWTPYHTHPTYGTCTSLTGISDASMPSLMNGYWTNYVNNPTYGLYNSSNVRFAVFVEAQSGNGNGFGLTVERVVVTEIATLQARTIWGATSGADVGLSTAVTTIDSSKYKLYGGGACIAALTNPSYPCSTGNSAIASVVNREAKLVAYLGQTINAIQFYNANGGSVSAGPNAATPSMNGVVPMLEMNATIPSTEPVQINAYVTSFGGMTYDYNRFSWSGLIIYTNDNLGRVRPIFKTGLYEWLGYLGSWYMACSTSSCSWSQTGGTFTIGGSVTTAPTTTVPWRYSLVRDAVAGTWMPNHYHPTYGEWNSGNGAAPVTDSQLAAWVNAAWTSYYNTNPAWDWLNNIKVAMFVEAQSGTTPGIGYTVARFNIVSQKEQIQAANMLNENIIYNAGVNAGGQCAYMQPNVQLVSRTAACAGVNCAVNATANMNAVPHTVSIKAVSAANSKSAAAVTDSFTPYPQLPVDGAQLFLDANSMPSYVGSTPSVCSLNMGSGEVCQPTLYWPSVENKSYLFSQVGTASARPMLKQWSPSRPYQSFVFDGVDDRLVIDGSQASRDGEFSFMHPDETGFNPARDAQTTWFMLYFPTEATAMYTSRTVFSKGTYYSGGAYAFYQQKYRYTGSAYEQQLGFFADGQAYYGGRIGQKWVQPASTSAFLGNPHAVAAQLVTVTHARNNSFAGLSANRAYRLDACEGIQTGNRATDRCSYDDPTIATYPRPAGSVSPWMASDNMGDNGYRTTLPAGVGAGWNWVDYASNQAPPAAFGNGGIFAIGGSFYSSSFISDPYRGQLMALVMYRRILNVTERNSVQNYLLQRYNQLCPALPVPFGATGSGCAAAGSGSQCIVTCDGSASPPNARVGGSSTLTCSGGAWVGKMPVCAATCPARSSPKDFATCTQAVGDYTFTDNTQFSVPSLFSQISRFDSAVPMGGPWSLMDKIWSVTQPVGFSYGMLVGTPVLASGCNPVFSGGVILSENAPLYLDKQVPGQRSVAEVRLRLLADKTQAGVATRISGTATSGRNAYYAVIGRTTAGANNNIALYKMLAGVTTLLTSIPLSGVTVPAWDLTGLPSAQSVTLRLTSVSFSSTILSQVITVELVSGSTATVVFRYTDASSPLSTGSSGLVVNSGSAGFEYLKVSSDCDSSGAVCNLYGGQSCSWTCSNGTIPAVGGIPYPAGTTYWESCSTSGSLPPASGQFSCVPLPPAFPSVNLSVREDAMIGDAVGTLTATPVAPTHVALFSLVPSMNNSDVVKDKYGAAVGTVTDVFGVGMCSGQVVVAKGGVISYDRGKRFFTLLATACTNGNPIACTNATVRIDILNVPSAPYFLRDPDTNLDNPWVRSIPENVAVGTFLYTSSGLAGGAGITATSPEGNALVYSIAFGNSDSTFGINTTTGMIYVATAGLLDFESSNQRSLVIRATDASDPTLFEQLSVQVNVLDRNDPPMVPSTTVDVMTTGTGQPLPVDTQYLTINEGSIGLANSAIGSLTISDQDANEVFTSAWVGNVTGPLVVNATNTIVTIQLGAAQLPFPAPELSPVIVWRGQNVRAVWKGVVKVTDKGGASVTVPVEVGVLTNLDGSGGKPTATSVTWPSALGMQTRGGETITILGSNFNTIPRLYSNIVNASIISQASDPYPGRVYDCTGCKVTSDSSITCSTPNGWGKDLLVVLTYGTSKFYMASAALLISYKAPTILTLGGSASWGNDPSIGTRDNLPTFTPTTLVITGTDLGTPQDALKVITFEYGNPVPNTDKLEYVASIIRCPTTHYSNMEGWATPSKPGGADGNGNSRICMKTQPGFGALHRYQIRVGTLLSNLSYACSTCGTGWTLSYSVPTVTRVYKPTNLLGAWPMTWDNSAVAGAGMFSPYGGETVCFNGTALGPMTRMPMVTFSTTIATVSEGVANSATKFNYTPGLLSDGTPSCWKPNPPLGSNVVCCLTPPGVGSQLKLAVRNGNQNVGTGPTRSYSYYGPNLTAVSGAGTRNANTEGGQVIILSGINFGPLDARFKAVTTNAYQPDRGLMAATVTSIPITLWYGPTGTEYIATGCAITNEIPAEMQCKTVPGVGKNFTYKLQVADKLDILRGVIGTGYAPPLISSIARVAADQVYDATLDAVPGPKDYMTSGGEAVVINGRNFGPCPGPAYGGVGTSVPCTMGTSSSYFQARYYITLTDGATSFNDTTLGDSKKQIWYDATNCSMTVLHQQIVCYTAIGAGTDAVIKVTIAGQTSVLPTTGFTKPSITGLAVVKSDLVTPQSNGAAPDGGDVLIITGSNFGPSQPSLTKVTINGTDYVRGLIQAITFGPTGIESAVTNWNLQYTNAGPHSTIYAYLPPGTGVNQKVVVQVADQQSPVSVASFDYMPPVITSVSPASGPTDPSLMLPVKVTISGNNFGLLNPNTDLQILFGNPEDGTLVTTLPVLSMYPDRSKAADVRAYLATPSSMRVESVTFNLPAGIGAQRAIRISLTDKRSASSVPPIVSAPAFFDYATPSISTVVVEALQQFMSGENQTEVQTDEFVMAVASFSDEDLPLVRKLTILGSNFGQEFWGNNLGRNVDCADYDTPNATAPDTEWTEAALNTNMVIFSWSTTQIVVLTDLPRANIRVRTVAQQFAPVTPPVYLAQASSPYRFDDLSPAIGNLVGTNGPFNTAGGDIIAFTVQNLVSVAASVTVTVDGNLCPLVYAADDARGASQVVAAGDIRSKLILNTDSGRAYFDTATPSVDSIWTLYCKLPAGEGSAARLVVARDTLLSGELVISYALPIISSVQIYDAATSSWGSAITYVPGQTVITVPTIGTRLRITGSDFGVCPGVIAGTDWVHIDMPGCNATRAVQAGSMATNVASSAMIEFTVPEGEGAFLPFAVTAGDQTSGDAQPITFSHFDPAISYVTPSGSTPGGDVITINGTNFGISAPYVTIGGQPCSNVQRADGITGHYSISCSLAEGTGKDLDVVVKVGGMQQAVSLRAFSYFAPSVDQVIVETVDDDADVNVTSSTVSAYWLTTNGNTSAVVPFASGSGKGGYKVTLIGNNFGKVDYSSTRSCLFVSWRGRAGNNFACDMMESFVGEGEIPTLALAKYADGTGAWQWSHNQITFLFPPGYGVRDIVIWVNGQMNGNTVFRYDAPTITNELSPNHGPTNGGTRLRLTGAGFGTPVIDTSSDNGKREATTLTVPQSEEAYLAADRMYAPQAAVVVKFGRGCVVNYLSASGTVPSFLNVPAGTAGFRGCENGLDTAGRGILSHTQNELSFYSAGGIGVNRTVSVTIVDIQPSGAGMEPVYIESNIKLFSYDAPLALLSTPRPIEMEGASDIKVTVAGINFGTSAQADAQGWSASEKAVNVTVGGVAATTAVRGIVQAGTGLDTIEISLPTLTVGYHNLSYLVAGQVGFTDTYPTTRAAVLTACAPGTLDDYHTTEMGPFGGYFGREGETCLPCPSGAICTGFDNRRGPINATDRGEHMYPIPVIGFYNLNSSDTKTTGMNEACPDDIAAKYPGRDICIVRCDPPEACLGDNQCAPQYVSQAPYFRCASCAPGFYKRATECIKCPDSPYALVIGFALLVVIGGGIAYWLNRIKINIAYAAIAIDYFQVLSIFAQSRVQWPEAIQELFHVLSAFNLNIEIVAPECIVPNLGFQRKWSFIMALPLSLQVFFGIVILLSAGYKALIKGQKVKLAHLGGGVMASVLMVMYLLYIYLTRTILDVFNCRPTDPPDGKTYLTVVFEECGKPGGVQMTLLPAAIVAAIVYICGYPLGVGYLLWQNRETVMEDQLLRAKMTGDDRLSNPNAYLFRKRWGRLYYQFKPDTILWVLAIIVRKFLIAATFILFNKQPSFQMAAVFLIIFLAYSAQMRFEPYMSPSDFSDVLREHEQKAYIDATHARLRAALSGIATRTQRKTRRNVMNQEGEIDTQALLGLLTGWLFNYNTVEQLMLFSAGIVSMMGLMFAAQNKKQQYYQDSRDAITSVVILIVTISIIYLGSVFVIEVVTLAGQSQRRKAAESSNSKSKKAESIGRKNKKAGGDDDSQFTVGDVQSSMNPMLMGGSKVASSSADDASSPTASQDDLELSSLIATLREPPATREQWAMYREAFNSLADTIENLKSQISAAPDALKDGVDLSGTSLANAAPSPAGPMTPASIGSPAPSTTPKRTAALGAGSKASLLSAT